MYIINIIRFCKYVKFYKSNNNNKNYAYFISGATFFNMCDRVQV